MLDLIHIDFESDDDVDAENNYIDYFEIFDERLKNEIPGWKKLKDFKKSLQGMKNQSRNFLEKNS